MTKFITFLFFILLLGSVSAQQSGTWKELNSLANANMEAANYDTALVFAYKALRQAKVEFGVRDTNYIHSVGIIGLVHFYKGAYDSTEIYWNQHALLCKEIVGEKHRIYANSLGYLAVLYSHQGKYKEVEALYLEGIQIQKEVLGEKYPDYAILLGNLALLYNEQGKYKEAESLHLEAIKIQKETIGEKHLHYAYSLEGLSNLYFKQGKYKEAELLLLDVLKIKIKTLGEKHFLYSISLNNLATLYRLQGKYKGAEPLHLEAIKIQKERVGKKHPDYAISLGNLALLYRDQGKYKEAEPLYITALKTHKEVLGEKHPDYAISLSNLALLYRDQGKYKEAESLYTAALKIEKEVLGEKHPSCATGMRNLAVLYTDQGKYSEAEPLYTAALKLEKEVLGEKHPSYAISLHNLAFLYTNQGKYKQADSLFLTAKQIHKEVLGIKHINYIKVLFNLAKLSTITNQFLSADSIFTEALALQHKLLTENFAVMSDRDRTDFLATIKENYEYYHYFSQHCRKESPTIYGNVYNVLLQQKGVLLYSTQKMRQLITESQDSVVNHLYIEWLDEKSYGNKMAQLPKEKRESMGINLLEIQHTADSLEKAICYKLPAFQEAITIPRGDWKVIQAQLKRNEAAIEIVRFRTFNKIKATDTVYYVAYILTSETKTQPIYVCMPNGKEMEGAWLKDYQSSINNKNLDTSAYMHYFQAIAQHLPAHIQKIYFAADGVYHELNLAVFQLPSPQKNYLISQYDIVNVGTTADILKFPSHNLKKEAFLVANPKTNAPASALALLTENEAVMRDNLFANLTAAEKEAKYLDSLTQRYFWKNMLVTGIDAKEAIIKQMQAPRIALFAMHGSVNAIDTTLDAYYNDYMRRSWLVLTGYKTIKDNRDSSIVFAEDGKLTPEEIGDMNLYGTELVILSACESGRGQTSNGEGVYGLQRGFKIAGAENIIMTLDKVEDNDAMRFMKRFYYQYIVLGKSVHNAFVATQLECIEKKDISIKTWANFILAESKVREL
jgi:tetratricopeptide (TPR) repeat protein